MRRTVVRVGRLVRLLLDWSKRCATTAMGEGHRNASALQVFKAHMHTLFSFKLYREEGNANNRKNKHN